MFHSQEFVHFPEIVRDIPGKTKHSQDRVHVHSEIPVETGTQKHKVKVGGDNTNPPNSNIPKKKTHEKASLHYGPTSRPQKVVRVVKMEPIPHTESEVIGETDKDLQIVTRQSEQRRDPQPNLAQTRVRQDPIPDILSKQFHWGARVERSEKSGDFILPAPSLLIKPDKPVCDTMLIPDLTRHEKKIYHQLQKNPELERFGTDQMQLRIQDLLRKHKDHPKRKHKSNNDVKPNGNKLPIIGMSKRKSVKCPNNSSVEVVVFQHIPQPEFHDIDMMLMQQPVIIYNKVAPPRREDLIFPRLHNNNNRDRKRKGVETTKLDRM